MRIAVLYTLFAGIATLVNLGTQYVSLALYSGAYSLYLAMLAGTFTGLVVKYILDKKYIFLFVPAGKKDDLYRFILYTAMGVITTVIFWGSEVLFDALIQASWAKYAGAVFGLSIGYITKYRLDKKFVFGQG